ncbi:6-O-methylguanine DNA methyltransferase [Kockovaella imperatae]|uniref:Methylated-DNA--protein-cysteine methyltransferase n=1 Tax=Kockovaella imperatae TaxID=4999 RepID=A0A1Y1UIN3_9TREE|nr:6-O-methylguanine DNA methyltransferase [Kockovaella imperatae]ORX37417.1 6-O-methylguanine DNA methyltransferase [Kockovaella imperatae]
MIAVMSPQIPRSSIVASDEANVFYPVGNEQRKGFLNKRSGKEVSDFQWRVYDHIKAIPSGQITTYAEIARSLLSSPRAVGGALRINPFCPLIPCHRVVAANGSLTGFAGQTGTGSALDDKARLLKSEGIDIRPDTKVNGYTITKKDMLAKSWSRPKKVSS